MDNKNLKTHSQYVMENRKKNNDVLTITLPKGERDKLKAIATQRGYTMNEFVRMAICNEIDRLK